MLICLLKCASFLIFSWLITNNNRLTSFHIAPWHIYSIFSLLSSFGLFPFYFASKHSIHYEWLAIFIILLNHRRRNTSEKSTLRATFIHSQTCTHTHTHMHPSFKCLRSIRKIWKILLTLGFFAIDTAFNSYAVDNNNQMVRSFMCLLLTRQKMQVNSQWFYATLNGTDKLANYFGRYWQLMSYAWYLSDFHSFGRTNGSRNSVGNYFIRTWMNMFGSRLWQCSWLYTIF